jgi:hypothetical protein
LKPPSEDHLVQAFVTMRTMAMSNLMWDRHCPFYEYKLGELGYGGHK